MLEFGQYISFVVLVIVGMITDLHLSGKTHVATCPGYMAKVPGALFLLCKLSQKWTWNVGIWDRILISWH